jgi:amidohydrolase
MRKLHFIPIFFVLSIQLHAQSDVAKLKERVSAAADKIETKCIAWRRDIHEHPELGNREFRTAKLISEHLKNLELK